MTKFAVEAFSDAVRIEMNKFGVTVSVVEPGHFGGATESLNVCLLHHHSYCFFPFSFNILPVLKVTVVTFAKAQCLQDFL